MEKSRSVNRTRLSLSDGKTDIDRLWTCPPAACWLPAAEAHPLLYCRAEAHPLLCCRGLDTHESRRANIAHSKEPCSSHENLNWSIPKTSQKSAAKSAARCCLRPAVATLVRNLRKAKSAVRHQRRSSKKARSELGRLRRKPLGRSPFSVTSCCHDNCHRGAIFENLAGDRSGAFEVDEKRTQTKKIVTFEVGSCWVIERWAAWHAVLCRGRKCCHPKVELSPRPES